MRWRWQIQDAELQGEMCFKSGRACHYKRADMVEAWNRGYRKAKKKSEEKTR